MNSDGNKVYHAERDIRKKRKLILSSQLENISDHPAIRCKYFQLNTALKFLRNNHFLSANYFLIQKLFTPFTNISYTQKYINLELGISDKILMQGSTKCETLLLAHIGLKFRYTIPISSTPPVIA